MTWTQLFRKMRPNWYFGKYNEQKAILAFEFGIIISDVANRLNVGITKEIVLNAEEILTNEMKKGNAEDFACNMIVLALAVLEPKEV